MVELRYNKISVVKNLQNMTNLKQFYLSNNQIGLVECTQVLNKMENLEIKITYSCSRPNQIESLGSLANANAFGQIKAYLEH